MFVQRVNYGEISVIPFIFPLYSHYYLLLLRANYETIILYNHMANVIKLRKGLDINLKGKAAEELSTVKEPGFYALVPDDFPGVTPKVVVKEQEYVMAGGPLFIDKNHPEVKFVSPVSGVVTSVERGARRKVLNIVVEAAAEQDYEEFGKKDVSKLDGEAVKAALLEAGMFAFMKQRPYDVIADPTVAPRAIFISAFDSNPLAPDFEYVLKGEEANFQTGLDALAKIAKTYLGISIKQKSTALTQAKNVTVTVFDGPNPAGNVGVQINHVAPVVKGETVWTIGAEAVIFIGRLFNTGRVDLTRTVAVTGSEVVKPAYCKLKVGALLTHVFAGNVTKDKELRYISGNVLTGKQVKPNGFLGAFDSQLTVIPEGDDIHEMLGWIMPRFNQFSVNRSYFSWLMGNKKEYVLDARIKGGERHMIMSGEYDKVFPMDILPEFLIKAIIAGDIDRMEALGIYEVAPEDFALCEFVDSSKLELQRIVRAGLDMLRAEMM
ncbi:na(+)-translocating NADH-quinone reductase subunit A [Bacteroides fragilis]|jgi:Na+-transporting NADH:ubiquinone oxidoreductase subunit A|nr:na(+)-translocating NADH-quinone reductase subunit A [Bacteroides fragilis]OCR39542.1 na(+)-translocating NADH-quinone reductase subunit A [Bacteroides fragilis]OCR40474.1 na(+)-translocating NADH-quinone reductase subunit A [Bacteroides fragilis]